MNTASITQFIRNQIPEADTTATLAALTTQYPLFETGHLLQSLLASNSKEQTEKSILYAPKPLLMEQRRRTFKAAHNNQPADLGETSTPIKLPEEDPKPETSKERADELVFDALHTIDYFASQGIKLQQDHLGNDPLSNQVKTFTQWLKTMKKIYNHSEGKAPIGEDSSVTKIAHNSNDSAEIITETMAVILVQQGKTDQALLVYQKLSLLYPEKSSYFTARINELKN